MGPVERTADMASEAQLSPFKGAAGCGNYENDQDNMHSTGDENCPVQSSDDNN